VELDDETLRDGLQSPSVTNPPLEKRKEILRLMDQLGVDTADVGLPAAGPHVVEAVTALVECIRDEKLRIQANCAARTTLGDAEAVVGITQKTGVPIEVCLFIGSSPIRQYAEDWDLDRMLHHTEESVSWTIQQGNPVMFVTEDTTRAHPDTLKKLYATAIQCGAKRLCVADTVGHATPDGVRALVRFIIEEVVEPSGEKDVEVDWHGHKDRGLDLINTLAAAEAGATRLHGCALGIGERSGNTPMELIMTNLKLLGWRDLNLDKLPEYCRTVSEACEVPIPKNYPVIGKDAFETGTGVHAAAVIKAFKKNDPWLADRVYSAVPSSWVGRTQEIRIGPMSGKSNVIFWLQQRGHEITEEVVDRIFEAGKASPRLLEEEEILALLKG
jgi:2-isopropylmalate synthase